MEQIKANMFNMKQDLKMMKERNAETSQAYIESIPMIPSVPSQMYEKAVQTTVKKWSMSFANRLGVAACIILSKVEGQSQCNIFLRWHALPTTVLSGSLASTWPSWLNLSLQPRLSVQHIIPVDSPLVDACLGNDAQLIRDHLSSGKAHPNDTTVENHTLLHVRVLTHQSHLGLHLMF